MTCHGRLGDQIWLIVHLNQIWHVYVWCGLVCGNIDHLPMLQLHIINTIHLVTPGMVMGLREVEVRGTKFGFSVHLNQIWPVVSLRPRYGQGGGSGKAGVGLPNWFFSSSQPNLACGFFRHKKLRGVMGRGRKIGILHFSWDQPAMHHCRQIGHWIGCRRTYRHRQTMCRCNRGRYWC